ncbi:XrtA/PEP-CTERM system TPR-repeat protein PrsT [Pleionea sp. CnH1-48]|uniref:XrtA/PEP-CTERM system TPR-repeat protein PrsT n=1 Tax=Pleionea sp. CnH1-48 TaxID=2954494 RepID=UPI0020985B61|nr:XrtA/PEP-CTERM system TPR-repeat protein PrsT [Pleionea sp. CnH1-48]MCO7226237.1 PEP-CTERM system TPR-repeat protein PrsT [Pleionea sp. CnH1-48]
MKRKQLNLLVATLLSSALTVQTSFANEALKKAEDFLASNDLKAAVIELKNAIQEEPKNGHARFLLGETYLRMNQWGAAEKELLKAAENGVDKLKWLRPLSQVFHAQGKVNEIKDYIKAEDKDSPKVKAEVLAILGAVDDFNRDLDSAGKKFSEALKLDPENTQAYIGLASLAFRQNKLDDGLIQVDKALALQSDNQDALLLKAQLKAAGNKVDEAIAVMQSAIDAHPNFIKGRFLRANLNLAQKGLDAAKVDVDYLKQILPNHFLVDVIEGKYYLVKEEFDKSKEILTAALTKTSKPHPELEKMLGLIEVYDKNWQKAEFHLSAAKRLNPGDYNISILLANLYRTKLNKPAEAIKLYEMLAKVMPGSQDIIVKLADSYSRNGETDKATAVLEKQLSQSNDDSGKLQTMLAQTRLTTGDVGKAIEILESSSEKGEASLQNAWLGMSYIRAKNYGKAEQLLNEVVAKNPDQALFKNILGIAYLSQQKYTDGLKQFEASVKLNPTYKAAQLNIVRTYMTQKQYDKAIAYLHKVDDVFEKKDAQISYGLFQAYLTKKDIDTASTWLDTTLKRDPGFEAAVIATIDKHLSKNDLSQAVALANEFVVNKPESAEAFFQLGRVYLAYRDNSELSKAIEALQKAANLGPKNLKYTRILASAFLREGNRSRALDAYERFLVQSPDNVFATTAKVRLLIADKKFNKANRVVDSLLQKAPTKAIGLELSGDVLLAQQKKGEAKAKYQASFKTQPTARVAQKLHRAYVDSAEVKQAELVLDEWLKSKPDDISSRFMLADFYQREKKASKAMNHYQKILEIQPKNVFAMNNLAWMYMEAGDNKAVALADKIAEMGPKRADILDTVGWIYVKFKQPKKGLKLLEQAVALDGNLREVRYHAAVAHFDLGQKSKAKSLIEELVKSGKPFMGQDEAKKLLKKL